MNVQQVTGLFLGLAVVASCGGIAIVDPGTLGAGGDGGAGTTDDDGSPICATQDPVGELEVCGGTSGAGAGQPVSCATTLCDQENNTWRSICEGDSCRCLFNNAPRCSCVLDSGGEFCGGVPSCCPSPFPE